MIYIWEEKEEENIEEEDEEEEEGIWNIGCGCLKHGQPN